MRRQLGSLQTIFMIVMFLFGFSLPFAGLVIFGAVLNGQDLWGMLFNFNYISSWQAPRH